VHDEPGAEPAADGGTRIAQEQSRYDIAAAWHLDRFMIERTKIRWGFNNYAHDEIEAGGAVGTAFSNDEWEGRVEFILQPMGRWDGVVGFQFADKDFRAIGEEAFVPPSSRDSQALFVFEKADFGDVHIDLGFRLETQHAASSAFAGEVDHNLLSISAGASWHFRADQELGFSASRSQRAPSIEELFADGPHLASNTYEIGNPHLGEETSHSLDVFWRKHAGRVRFTFTAFLNDIADFTFLRFNDRNGDGVADRVEEDFGSTGIIVDEDDALLLVDQAQADALFWGIELEASATVFDNAHGLLDLRLWTDRVTGEFDEGGYVPRIPPPRFGAALDWSRDGYYAQLAATRTTRQDDLAELETRTPAFTELNVQVGYRLSLRRTELSLFARGSNLLDETQRRHVSLVKDLAPRPGIAGLIGVRLRY
ncbi:MAG: TonB-dependent receptor domain-containing protein, partial [Gammaproteobacteria bacterium]